MVARASHTVFDSNTRAPLQNVWGRIDLAPQSASPSRERPDAPNGEANRGRVGTGRGAENGAQKVRRTLKISLFLMARAPDPCASCPREERYLRPVPIDPVPCTGVSVGVDGTGSSQSGSPAWPGTAAQPPASVRAARPRSLTVAGGPGPEITLPEGVWAAVERGRVCGGGSARRRAAPLSGPELVRLRASSI